MRLPKTIAGIPIILIVLLPCLYCLYFQVKNHLIRQEMREKLERDNLQTVIVPVKDFRWYEEDREIIVDGTMFDVKTISVANGIATVIGIWDHREKELLDLLSREESQGNGSAPVVGLLQTVRVSIPPAFRKRDRYRTHEKTKHPTTIACLLRHSVRGAASLSDPDNHQRR